MFPCYIPPLCAGAILLSAEITSRKIGIDEIESRAKWKWIFTFQKNSRHEFEEVLNEHFNSCKKNPPTHRAHFQIFDRQKGGRNVYLLNTQRKCLRNNSHPYFILAKMNFLDSKSTRPSNRPLLSPNICAKREKNIRLEMLSFFWLVVLFGWKCLIRKTILLWRKTLSWKNLEVHSTANPSSTSHPWLSIFFLRSKKDFTLSE